MKKIKDRIARIVYHLLVWIARILPAKAGEKHLLIIKLDEIGDYMLFRNYLKYFRQSPVYAGHKITLLGNAAWKPIFDEYDCDSVDDSIWVAKKMFNRNLLYRFGLFRQVRKTGFSDVINCVYSRFFVLEDGFAFVATGKNKIGYHPEQNNTNRGQNGFSIDNRIYTKLIDSGNDEVFDMYRTRKFLSTVLEMNLPLCIRLNVRPKIQRPPDPYFAVFIGAGNMIERKWPVENFLECAKYIHEKTGWYCVVCGAPPDVEDGLIFERNYGNGVGNYVGKTTLPGFIDLMAGARMLLSVDTGPVHMAAAAGCTVVGLFSGVHYGRYAPYPAEVSDRFFPVYAGRVEALVAAGSKDVYNPFVMQNRFISLITVDKVKVAIDKALTGSDIHIRD